MGRAKIFQGFPAGASRRRRGSGWAHEINQSTPEKTLQKPIEPPAPVDSARVSQFDECRLRARCASPARGNTVDGAKRVSLLAGSRRGLALGAAAARQRRGNTCFLQRERGV